MTGDTTEFEKAAHRAGLSTVLSHRVDGEPVYLKEDTKAAYKIWQAARERGAEPVHQFQPPSTDEAWIDCNERDLRIYQQDGHWPTRTLYTQPQSARVPEGFVLMPESLTAENGAKYALSGEFHEVVELECTACDEDDDDCEVCSGHGSYTYRVPISWTAIKQIYSLAVNNLSAATAPQPAGDWVRCRIETAAIALEALEFYAAERFRGFGDDPEPIEHHLAQEAMGELRPLTPQPPQQGGE